MKKLTRLTSISLAIIMCSSVTLSYADADENVIEIKENIDEEMVKPEVIELTLKKAIEKGLKNSPQIKQSILDMEQANVEYRENKYDIRENKKMLYDEKETTALYIDAITIPEKGNDFALENSKRQHEIIKDNLKKDIEENYTNLLQAQKLVDVNKSNLELTKRLLKVSEIKEEVGLAIKQETESAKLNQRKAVETYEESVKNLENAKMFFNTTIGLDSMQQIVLLDELDQKELNIRSKDSEQMDEVKDEVKEKENNDNKNNKEEHAQEIEELSDIDYYIERAFNKRNEIMLLDFNRDMEELKMEAVEKQYSNITFRYKEQRIALEKAEKSLKDAKDNIELEVRSSYKQLIQQKEELESSKQSVDLAKETLRIAEVSYEVGVGIAMDIENAKNQLKQAELGLFSLVAQYNLQILKFETIVGMGKAQGGR